LEKLAQMVVSGCFGGISVYRGSLGLVRSLQPVLRLGDRKDFTMREAERLFLKRIVEEKDGVPILREGRAHDLARNGIPLFGSNILLEGETDEAVALQTLNILQANRDNGISFYGLKALVTLQAAKYDEPEGKGIFLPIRGTCSARTLDFLARHLTECPFDSSFAEQTNCIASFAKFYEGVTTVFPSRQGAFDTIRVDAAAAGREELMAAKMSSLARLHKIELKPQNQSLSLPEKKARVHSNELWVSEIETIIRQSGVKTFEDRLKHIKRGEGQRESFNNGITREELSLIDVFDRLPFGRYLIRGVLYADNWKQEHHGHSMAYIKTPKGSFFFDPARGARAILRDGTRDAVRQVISERSWYDTVRVYKASCGNGGCTNISDDVGKVEG